DNTHRAKLPKTSTQIIRSGQKDTLIHGAATHKARTRGRKRDMADITPEPIFQLATGFMSAKHMFIANEIGLFTALADGPAPLDRLAALTGIARPRVRILADALVTLGLIERQGAQYQNGPLAAAFLSGKGPADLPPFLRFWNHISY